jgi:hypothetical protein
MGAIYCLTTPVNAMCVLRWLNTIFTMSRIFFSRSATPYLVSSNFNFKLLCAAVALDVVFRLCFLVLGETVIVRCMGLSYQSIRKSERWLSFRRSLFTLTSCSRRIIWMSSTSGFRAWLSFFEGGREMSINRRKGIRNVTKGKISLKFDGVLC